MTQQDQHPFLPQDLRLRREVSLGSQGGPVAVAQARCLHPGEALCLARLSHSGLWVNTCHAWESGVS